MPLNYLENLLQRHPVLVPARKDILAAYETIRLCFESGGKLLIAGNGGSAADAEHISGELLKGFCCKRPLSADIAGRLPDGYAEKLQMGLPAIPLTSFIGLSTAFANDLDAGFTYAQLILALGRPGDVFLAISTSGNSKNILRAAHVAAGSGVKIVALTGLSGGSLCKVADSTIRVPQNETHLVQELHLPVYHTLCLMLEEYFFGDKG